MKNIFKLSVIVIVAMASANTLIYAQTLTSKYFESKGVAISGYDVVSYFGNGDAEGSAQKGSKKFSYQFDGTTWYFASQKHLETFKKDPDAYIPQYGGYCAKAMASKSIAPVDPKAWTIHKGKLYLNYSLSVRRSWRRDIDNNISKADKFWSTLQ